MKNSEIHHQRSSELRYEIREIVSLANRIEKLGRKIIWENIGDPIARGHQIPNWMKSILRKNLMPGKPMREAGFKSARITSSSLTG